MDRRGAIRLAVLLIGVCVCAPLTAATSPSAVAAEPSCDEPFFGFGVGQPGGEGRVDLRTRAGVSRVISRWPLEQEAQDGDRFGAAVVLADLDGDECVDVVVGAPGVDGGGAVYVIYGTPAGLGTGASIRIPFHANPGDAFGKALAVETLNNQTTHSRFGRIWIGAPGRDVSGQANAGAVAYTEVVNGVASAPRLYTQNSPGVPGGAEPGDRFGEELAPVQSDELGRRGGVLVGQPSEDIGARVNAGMLTVLPAPGASPAGPGPYGVTEDTPGVPGAVETGDRFGAAVDAFRGVGWVGVPYEDLGAVRDVGMVHGLRLGATKVTSFAYLRQGQDNGATMPGRPEAGDHFGASVRGAYILYPDTCHSPQVVIGVPGEDVGTATNAGQVDSYMSGDQDIDCLDASAFTMGANANSGDRLGAALGVESDFGDGPDTVLLGIPGEDVATAIDAGVVVQRSFVGGKAGPFSTQAVYTQSDGSFTGAHYGAVLNR